MGEDGSGGRSLGGWSLSLTGAVPESVVILAGERVVPRSSSRVRWKSWWCRAEPFPLVSQDELYQFHSVMSKELQHMPSFKLLLRSGGKCNVAFEHYRSNT